MSQPLGRVADPKELDDCTGPRARLRLAVPAEWLQGTFELRIAVPRMLTCDRCHGGGCDGCGRSGALRAPEDCVLPLTVAAEGRGVKVRLAEPFEGVAQLIVEINAGELSGGVSRVGAIAPRKRISTRAVVVGLVLALALLGMSQARSCGMRRATYPASPR